MQIAIWENVVQIDVTELEINPGNAHAFVETWRHDDARPHFEQSTASPSGGA